VRDAALRSGLPPALILTLGVLAGLTRQIPNLGLIYFDGDIDMNTSDDSPSGILDGMGLAHLTGHATNELSRIGLSQPLLALNASAFPFQAKRRSFLQASTQQPRTN
jgi:arginase family enzyme